MARSQQHLWHPCHCVWTGLWPGECSDWTGYRADCEHSGQASEQRQPCSWGSMRHGLPTALPDTPYKHKDHWINVGHVETESETEEMNCKSECWYHCRQPTPASAAKTTRSSRSHHPKNNPRAKPILLQLLRFSGITESEPRRIRNKCLQAHYHKHDNARSYLQTAGSATNCMQLSTRPVYASCFAPLCSISAVMELSIRWWPSNPSMKPISFDNSHALGSMPVEAIVNQLQNQLPAFLPKPMIWRWSTWSNQCSACMEKLLSYGTIFLLFKPGSRRKLVCTTCLYNALCMSLTLFKLYADKVLTGLLFETSKSS